jgi:hypothetical protein
MTHYKLVFLFGLFTFSSAAQRKFTTIPAVGTHVWSISGAVDIIASNVLQYPINQRFSAISYTAFAYDVKKFSAFEDIKPAYSFTVFQRIGIGASLHTKRSENVFSLLGGVRYFAYKGSIENPKLEEKISPKHGLWSGDYGAMYSLNIGRKKRFFSSRIYLPLHGGKWGILENASLELGVGIRL